VFGGFFIFLGYLIGGLTICLTIVGIPIGWAYIKLGFASLAPFGKRIVTDADADSGLYWVMNVLWLVFIGWSMLLNHLFWAAVFGLTIVGLPFAKQHLKLIPVSAFPYGRSLA
ncbi:MAG: hypothetical protein NTV34_21240, partial [Proteobacteria bacterium]|nr:hypothetical protein [Pseudomonadota bacterium]